MARLIPSVDPSTITNKGERQVAEALLKQLPKDCRVFHSYPWLKTKRFNSGFEFLNPGEADFIILHPKLGLLVLEVKGGNLSYEGQGQEWVRVHPDGQRQKIQDPFNQAAHNMYAIKDQILKHKAFDGGQTFTHGYAVVFPHCRYQGSLPPHAEPQIVLTADHLDDLGRHIEEAISAWCRTSKPLPLQPHQLDAMQEALCPLINLTPVLWRTLDDQEERLKRLTKDQERVLKFLEKQERAAIEGVAGSGKTILAIAQAQRFLRRGLRTLLVCYNEPLASWIRQQTPDIYTESLTVVTFHSLCSILCHKAKVPFPVGKGGQDFWNYEAPDLLEKAADLLDDDNKFDAIVVDEGQDFKTFWWTALERAFTQSATLRPLFVFYDPRQNIYIDRPELPSSLGKPYSLTTNCRNTRNIANLCGEIISLRQDIHEDAPEGEKPTEIEVHGLKDVINNTRKTIQDWCLHDRGDLTFKRAAVLVPDLDKAWPSSFGAIKLTQDFDAWRRGEGVLLSTYRRFKGLEADALVLAGIPRPGVGGSYTPADHYVACSRAKHLLKIIWNMK